MSDTRPRTLGELKASGWTPRGIREELRGNLITALRAGASVAERWPGIRGFEDTVIPQIENALLSRHDFILLGLRGQAKTRILRSLTRFLDEAVPALEGCDLNDDPYAPISGAGQRLVADRGDDAPIRWIPREERYREKLATPDVTIADLIGDVDPIKAASRGASLDDEAALQFGLVPRTNRGIFAINELPDLAPRIQVGLLNILEERDVQLRSFPVRIPLDVLLVFSANPEDYTNRGSIITPLRDRIASQILTHYPTTMDVARAITDQEAYVDRDDKDAIEVHVPAFLREAIEESAFQARKSEYVDQGSGVSVRLTIALLENVVSNAERRAILRNRTREVARVSDLFAALSAVTGKIELVFEGEREGPAAVAERVVGDGCRAVFERYFPAPYQAGKRRKTATGDEEHDAYKPIVDWFAEGNAVVVSDREDSEGIRGVPTLEGLVTEHMSGAGVALAEDEVAVGCELVLEGLHQASLLSKEQSVDGVTYGDMLQRMFAGFDE